MTTPVYEIGHFVLRGLYLVVGAYAVIHHTEPRYTKDIDIWIATDPENAKKTYEVLKEFGAPVEQITPEDLTNPNLVYQIGVEPNRIDIMMGLKGSRRPPNG